MAARPPARSRPRRDRQLSAIKPTLAILTESAYSAGYLLASAARQIVMPRDRRRRSIGAIIDARRFVAKARKHGIKVTLIASGAHKTDGHPALPLVR
jgi:ClpP class serine protease